MRRLRLAIQKSGRLTEKTLELLKNAGIEFNWSKDKLFSVGLNFPMDLLMVRDDDIPDYVLDGVCDLGVVGQNVLKEKTLKRKSSLEVIFDLGFGSCRLSLALPKEKTYVGRSDLEGLKIATSYPYSLKEWLDQKSVKASIVEISGSVEIAPQIGVADCVCDLVSTGNTLKSNGLKEVDVLFQSQSVLIQNPNLSLSVEKQNLVERLLQRVKGVGQAKTSKYIMLNCDLKDLSQIEKILPGVEKPSVMPLHKDDSRVAVHSVCREDVFWETVENLKKAGASGVLVLPIEKMMP